MPQNRSQQPQAASHTFTRPSLPIPDDLCRLLLLGRSQLSRHRGQILGLALCMSTHGSVTGTRQEVTGMFRHIRHRGRIGIRWRPGIHGRVHLAVPPRLGSCPPPIIGSLSAFQHTGRDRGQVSQAHDHGEHRTTRRRRYPGIPASYADVQEHAYVT